MAVINPRIKGSLEVSINTDQSYKKNKFIIFFNINNYYKFGKARTTISYF